jgi:PAS domain S-box-containing protein
MANNYNNYSHEQLIRQLHSRDKEIEILKHRLHSGIKPRVSGIPAEVNSNNRTSPFNDIKPVCQDNFVLSETWLHSIFEQAIVGIAQVDLHGRFLFINDQYCQDFGYAKGELLLMRMQALPFIDDLPFIMKSVQALANGGPDFHTEIRYRRKDGSIFWGRSSVTGIRDTVGTVLSIVVASADITQYKLAEDKYRTQTRLQTIVDTLTNGIITINSEGRIITFNRAAEGMFGFTEAEIKGHNFRELMPFPYNEQIDAYFEACANSGKSRLTSKSRDIWGKRKNGTMFPMSLGLGGFFQGNERFFTGIIEDISERKATETALRESEERLAFAMDASGEGVWDWDIVEGKAIHNHKCFELLGLHCDENINSPRFFSTLIHDDDREAVLGRIQQALNGDGHYCSEHRLLHSDGTYIWVLEKGTVVKRDGLGAPLRMVGSFADISERKKAERSLQESERRFRQITESLPQLVWTCQPDGTCDYLSRQWVEFTGIPETEQLGYRWIEQVHPADRRNLLRQWKATLKAGTHYTVEYRIRRHDGDYHWFEGRAILLRDEAGQVRKWFGSSTDITERKQVEQQLREHQQHYERLLKLEVASQTVAAIAHELNQPLNAAASYTDAALLFLEADTIKLEQLRTALLLNAQQIQRGGQVIHELCRFLRHGDIKTETFDPRALVETVLRNCEADGLLGKFTVITELAEQCPAVRADSFQIEKVLNNLIRNAIEAMEDAKMDSGALFVFVRPASNGDYAQITVRDTGPGLSENAIKQLFHPFFTSKPKGLGIGLAISRAMINAQGGELWAEANAVPGAIFHVTIPYANETLPW